MTLTFRYGIYVMLTKCDIVSLIVMILMSYKLYSTEK